MVPLTGLSGSLKRAAWSLLARPGFTIVFALLATFVLGMGLAVWNLAEVVERELPINEENRRYFLVHLQPGMGEARAELLAGRLRTLPGIDRIRVVTALDAFRALQGELGDGEVVGCTGEGTAGTVWEPPAALELITHHPIRTWSQRNDLLERLGRYPGIHSVRALGSGHYDGSSWQSLGRIPFLRGRWALVMVPSLVVAVVMVLMGVSLMIRGGTVRGGGGGRLAGAAPWGRRPAAGVSVLVWATVMVLLMAGASLLVWWGWAAHGAPCAQAEGGASAEADRLPPRWGALRVKHVQDREHRPMVAPSLQSTTGSLATQGDRVRCQHTSLRLLRELNHLAGTFRHHDGEIALKTPHRAGYLSMDSGAELMHGGHLLLLYLQEAVRR